MCNKGNQSKPKRSDYFLDSLPRLGTDLRGDASQVKKKEEENEERNVDSHHALATRASTTNFNDKQANGSLTRASLSLVSRLSSLSSSSSSFFFPRNPTLTVDPIRNGLKHTLFFASKKKRNRKSNIENQKRNLSADLLKFEK